MTIIFIVNFNCELLNAIVNEQQRGGNVIKSLELQLNDRI